MELEEQIYKATLPLTSPRLRPNFSKTLKAQIDKYREQNHALEESNRIITKKTMEMEPKTTC
jgi:hypothetical protein